MGKPTTSQPIAVAGAIIEQDGKILLVQEYMPHSSEHLLWNQPAGWIDGGENPIDAVIREVKEETGLVFTPEAVVGIYSLYKLHLQQEMGIAPHPIKIIFSGKIIGGELIEKNDEIAATRWFHPDEIYAMDSNTLRDADIKDEVRDYINGRAYPLTMIHHTVTGESYTQLV